MNGEPGDTGEEKVTPPLSPPPMRERGIDDETGLNGLPTRAEVWPDPGKIRLALHFLWRNSMTDGTSNRVWNKQPRQRTREKERESGDKFLCVRGNCERVWEREEEE